MRVLLAVDDPTLASGLGTALRRDGHQVSHAGSGLGVLAPGTAGEEHASPASSPELVLLESGAAEDNGVNLCRTLRDRGDVPIIMLSSRGSVRDRVAGLRAGADDYLVRPVTWAELAARIEAVSRRAGASRAAVLMVGPLRVDVDRHRAYAGAEPLELTRKEFQLLATLARRPDTVVRRDTLISEVWGSTWPGRSRTLDVHVATLRGKLGPAAKVETVRGVGYRIVPAATGSGMGTVEGLGRPCRCAAAGAPL